MALSTNAPRYDIDEKAADRADYGRHQDGSRASWQSALFSRIVMILMALLFLLPLYWMILSSLKSDEELALFRRRSGRRAGTSATMWMR